MSTIQDVLDEFDTYKAQRDEELRNAVQVEANRWTTILNEERAKHETKLAEAQKAASERSDATIAFLSDYLDITVDETLLQRMTSLYQEVLSFEASRTANGIPSVFFPDQAAISMTPREVLQFWLSSVAGSVTFPAFFNVQTMPSDLCKFLPFIHDALKHLVKRVVTSIIIVDARNAQDIMLVLQGVGFALQVSKIWPAEKDWELGTLFNQVHSLIMRNGRSSILTQFASQLQKIFNNQPLQSWVDVTKATQQVNSGNSTLPQGISLIASDILELFILEVRQQAVDNGTYILASVHFKAVEYFIGKEETWVEFAEHVPSSIRRLQLGNINHRHLNVLQWFAEHRIADHAGAVIDRRGVVTRYRSHGAAV